MTATIRTQPTLSAFRCSFVVLFSICAFSLLWCDAASAVTFSFQNITNNDPNDAAIGEAQLFVEVTNGAGTVSFRFFNTGPEDSNISEIYFDDGSLLGISSIIDNPPDVDFELDANPPDLPGGNSISPPFQVTEGFLAQAGNPAPMKGVNPLEEVTIMFDLIGGGTLQDVLGELNDGTLRIGIHVIDFASGGSESFVNVPEPTALSLMLLGLAAALTGTRRRVL